VLAPKVVAVVVVVVAAVVVVTTRAIVRFPVPEVPEVPGHGTPPFIF
jgi:hypothetical protein